jgi:hypothetical protein
MRRPFALAATLVLFVLALAFSLPYSTRTAKAAPPDKCVKCQVKVQRDLEKCEAQHGGPAQECYDQFNQGIVDCYATVCEQ